MPSQPDADPTKNPTEWLRQRHLRLASGRWFSRGQPGAEPL